MHVVIGLAKLLMMGGAIYTALVLALWAIEMVCVREQ